MNFYYVLYAIRHDSRHSLEMVLVFKTQFGLAGDRAQLQQKHGDGVME